MGARADLTSEMELSSMRNGEREPEEIRAEIQKTRAHISETVNIIQERLSPDRLKAQAQDMAEQLKEQAQDKVREATIGRIEQMADDVSRKASGMRYTITETIRQNPVPAALVGLGLGWLIMEGWNSASPNRYSQTRTYPAGGQYRYYEPGDRYREQSAVRQAFGDAQERVGEIANEARDQVQQLGYQARDQAQQTMEQVGEMSAQARDKMAEFGSQAREQVEYLGGQAREQAEYLGGQVQEQARWAKGQFWQTMEENPMAVGAAALALGLLVGFSLPETRYENRLMGETRDDLMDKAQEMTQDTMHKVQQVAKEVQETAQETAKEEAENQGLMADSR